MYKRAFAYKRKADLVFKVLAASCLCLMLMLVMADVLAEPITLKIVQARGGLNVRMEPTTQASAVYMLEDTETVAVLRVEGEWALVAKNHAPSIPLGWVSTAYLK